jgi:hypothetical protein
MPTKSPDSPSHYPDDKPLSPRGENRSEPGASNIQYVGIKEPKVSLPILLIGLGIVVAGIIGFLHFFRT